MSGSIGSDLAFFTCVWTPEQFGPASRMVASLRAFGGPLADRPFRIAVPAGSDTSSLPNGEGITVVPFDVPRELRGYIYAAKVAAAAAVERSVADDCRTLVWMMPQSLTVRPPVLFELEDREAAAVRPVHITNVGSLAARPPDAFWAGVYEVVGRPDPSFTIESFVEGETLRPYFNSAGYSIDPSLGLLEEWSELFAELVLNAAYQRAACEDEAHQIFLHQAVLSTLLAVSVTRDRIRMLPPDYCYPYNLHGRVPKGSRARRLGDVTYVIAEDRSLHPDLMDDLTIEEPLAEWLRTH